MEREIKDKELIDQQLDYYRARAPEYDQWFLRQRRYDRGPQHRAEWFQEVSNIENALRPIVEGKSIAELACGTGLRTERLVRCGARVLAAGAVPEAIDLNKQRLGSLKADYCDADIFTWSSTTTIGIVFFFILALARSVWLIPPVLGNSPKCPQARRLSVLH